jgi:hypothetical protein
LSAWNIKDIGEKPVREGGPSRALPRCNEGLLCLFCLLQADPGTLFLQIAVAALSVTSAGNAMIRLMVPDLRSRR